MNTPSHENNGIPASGAPSLLEREAARLPTGAVTEPDCFRDLNLDQIIAAAVSGREAYDLLPFFHLPQQDAATIRYRQDVFRDLQGDTLLEAMKLFSEGMRATREARTRATKLSYPYQRQVWFLRAVETYCSTLRALAAALATGTPRSEALRGFAGYISAMIAAPAFMAIETEALRLREALSAIRYNLNVRPGRIKVSRSDGEVDYSERILATFEKFRQGATKSHLTKLNAYEDMNHVEGGILALVARLSPDLFGALDAFRADNEAFVDPSVTRFERELQFYIAWLDHIAGFERRGLAFCIPEIAEGDKGEHCSDSFDLALAAALIRADRPLVTNGYELRGAERIIVVSGPNQGGKTTFAHMVGQMHYLAALGCPIPGTSARLMLADAIFTQFEREEDITLQRGKLEDELERIHGILQQASSRSLVIMNEIFNSTTLSDATFLSRRIFERLMAIDAFVVCVTFIDELSTMGPSTVSMVSTVVADDPARRSFRILRKAADGHAYAMALAEKYGLTEARILERTAS